MVHGTGSGGGTGGGIGVVMDQRLLGRQSYMFQLDFDQNGFDVQGLQGVTHGPKHQAETTVEELHTTGSDGDLDRRPSTEHTVGCGQMGLFVQDGGHRLLVLPVDHG